MDGLEHLHKQKLKILDTEVSASEVRCGRITPSDQLTPTCVKIIQSLKIFSSSNYDVILQLIGKSSPCDGMTATCLHAMTIGLHPLSSSCDELNNVLLISFRMNR